MMRPFLIYITIALIFLGLSTFVFAEETNKIQLFSLKIQRVFESILENIFVLNKKENVYQEKYFNLLQELSQLKLNLKSVDEENKKISELKNLKKLDLLKRDPYGYFYFENHPLANEGDIVVDSNLTLIGFVFKKNKSFIIVKSLLYPEIEFNVSDINGEFLGTGKTTGDGFLEVVLSSAKEIKKDSPIFTYGKDNIFPPNFLVGSLYEVKKTGRQEKLIVKLEGVFEGKDFYLFK
jgi:cell shape-determining protein MreC